jgi:dissimilatory sulfite reductase related protein
MALREYGGCRVEVTEEGFLVQAGQWTPEVAQDIAAELGIALTDAHWKVLNFCREDTFRQGQPPGLRRITQVGGVATKELYQLFPKGPGKLAARIAGLPKPQGCV